MGMDSWCISYDSCAAVSRKRIGIDEIFIPFVFGKTLLKFINIFKIEITTDLFKV